MKSNKLITTLIVVAVVLTLLLAGILGVIWYRYTHIFIEDAAYAKSSTSLDLREEDISFEHFNMLTEQLPQCSVIWNVPFRGGKVSSGSTEITVTDLTETDVNILCKYFPDLKKVDASACTNYEMLELLKKRAPNLTVLYQVSLGSASFAPDTESLVLNPEDYDYDTMLANLPHLPNVQSIQLKAPEIGKEQIQFLRDAHPNVKITCTVKLLGKEYDMETSHLDLSGFDDAQAAAAADKLSLLPELETVELNYEEDKSRLSMQTVKTLIEAAPQVKFNYTFEFYGKKINTQDEQVEIKQRQIGDEGEQAVRDALDLMQNCKRFVLDNCKISSEVMAKIRDDYRDKTKVVWRIYFGEGTSLTDAEILRSTYNVEDDNSHDLVYLEDVRFMDIGHNEWLDNADFISGMKNLEVCIVSGAPIHSLEPFKNCKNLRVLEMANCLYVPDLSPLAELENLQMLNIGFTKVKDLSPIADLKLTHLTMVHSRVSQADREKYQEEHPDCWVVAKGDIPYGKGWRYDNNNDPLPWYAEIKEVFRYPKAPNNVGWYLNRE